jgi:hypothetical protein
VLHTAAVSIFVVALPLLQDRETQCQHTVAAPALKFKQNIGRFREP